VTGREGRVLYLVLPGVPATGAGMGGTQSSCGCLMSQGGKVLVVVNLWARR